MSVSSILQRLLHTSDDDLPVLDNFINGEFKASEQLMYSINPATGTAWCQIPDTQQHEVNEAVNAAKMAFPQWSKKSVQHRSGLLLKLADLLEKNMDELAQLESRDQGKPVKLARSSLIEEPTKALNYVKNDPIGVAGLISPWNLPLYLLSFKLAPALATGNTVVCKPSELTSATAYVLMHAMKQVGFPAGVVNMVIGKGFPAGETLVAHPDVPLVSFTGSTPIGRRISEICARQNKKVSLEMGGKNACVIYPSADLEANITTIARSCFINQGEICLCSSRIFVHSSIYDEFLVKLIAEAKKFTVGDPSENFTLGAMNSEVHFKKVVSYIDLATTEGGTIHCGGVAKVGGACENGYFIAPTVISGLTDSARCMTEEIFGPVVCVTKFETTSEVVERVNSSGYGLSASVWSSDSQELINTANEIRVGTVWCNTWMVRDLNMPFGGTKQSGMGREGSVDSIHFFTEQKTVCIKL